MRAAVIVPTYNRPARLARCLDALARQEAEGFEIVVVDDGGTADLAPAIVACPRPVTLLRQENAGPGAARNLGARAAAAEILAFTDDDCRPEPGWLPALMRRLEAEPEALAGGHTVNLLGHNLYAEASQTLIDFLYDYFGAQAGAMPFFTSNNIACRREPFLELGGFGGGFPLAAAGGPGPRPALARARGAAGLRARGGGGATSTTSLSPASGASSRTTAAARGTSIGRSARAAAKCPRWRGSASMAGS